MGTPIEMEESSIQKPVQEIISKEPTPRFEEENIEKAEKIVGDIVQKAEKVIGEVQAQLNESDFKKTEMEASVPADKKSEEKEDEFVKISKESEEIIQTMEKSFEQRFVSTEEQKDIKNEKVDNIIKGGILNILLSK